MRACVYVCVRMGTCRCGHARQLCPHRATTGAAAHLEPLALKVAPQVVLHIAAGLDFIAEHEGPGRCTQGCVGAGVVW